MNKILLAVGVAFLIVGAVALGIHFYQLSVIRTMGNRVHLATAALGVFA